MSDDEVDVMQLDNDMWVWMWTSPGGACHQGARHFKRRGDALRAGRDWLTERMQEQQR